MATTYQADGACKKAGRKKNGKDIWLIKGLPSAWQDTESQLKMSDLRMRQAPVCGVPWQPATYYIQENYPHTTKLGIFFLLLFEKKNNNMQSLFAPLLLYNPTKCPSQSYSQAKDISMQIWIMIIDDHSLSACAPLPHIYWAICHRAE